MIWEGHYHSVWWNNAAAGWNLPQRPAIPYFLKSEAISENKLKSCMSAQISSFSRARFRILAPPGRMVMGKKYGLPDQ
jgi:hypothetical protein